MEVAMTEQGTLKELNVKPGDVVECVDHGVTEDHLTVGKYYGIVNGPMIQTDMGSWWGDGDLAHTAFPMLAEFRIISRAAQTTPKPDLATIKTRNILAKQIIGKVEVMNNGKVWMQHTESASEMRAAAETLNRMADMLEPRHD